MKKIIVKLQCFDSLNNMTVITVIILNEYKYKCVVLCLHTPTPQAALATVWLYEL